MEIRVLAVRGLEQCADPRMRLSVAAGRNHDLNEGRVARPVAKHGLHDRNVPSAMVDEARVRLRRRGGEDAPVPVGDRATSRSHSKTWRCAHGATRPPPFGRRSIQRGTMSSALSRRVRFGRGIEPVTLLRERIDGKTEASARPGRMQTAPVELHAPDPQGQQPGRVPRVDCSVGARRSSSSPPNNTESFPALARLSAKTAVFAAVDETSQQADELLHRSCDPADTLLHRLAANLQRVGYVMQERGVRCRRLLQLRQQPGRRLSQTIRGSRREQDDSRAEGSGGCEGGRSALPRSPHARSPRPRRRRRRRRRACGRAFRHRPPTRGVAKPPPSAAHEMAFS